MKCPTCNKPGFTPPLLGRPRELDDAEVRRLRKAGKSLREIAKELGVSLGGIQRSLKRKGKT